MTIVNAAQSPIKGVGDPNAEYESMVSIWGKCRAVLAGEQAVKDYDINPVNVQRGKLLIPFSNKMTLEQFLFYLSESELPGVTSQFARMLIGGLLRKQPLLELADNMPSDCRDWIMHNFCRDGAPISSFLEEALWEELQTSRAWVIVNYPSIEAKSSMTQAELDEYRPYPALHRAENVINWKVDCCDDGSAKLSKLLIRGFTEEYDANEFHPALRETVWVHYLDELGLYCVDIYKRAAVSTVVPTESGRKQAETRSFTGSFEKMPDTYFVENHGNRMDYIPAWPLNGNVSVKDPMLHAIVSKELQLYNKMSRRNHLLYGAATYTPVVCADIPDDEFEIAVSSGLGTWLHFPEGSTVTILDTPTDALVDMDRSISGGFEELAKLGVRMLAPEVAQSGVAMEIRDAGQTALLGVFSSTVSVTMQHIIRCMIGWRYGAELDYSSVTFRLSEDFDPVPLGADWLRLATEWYQQGLIPRSAWLHIVKRNDMLNPDYDDEAGLAEISSDTVVNAGGKPFKGPIV